MVKAHIKGTIFSQTPGNTGVCEKEILLRKPSPSTQQQRRPFTFWLGALEAYLPKVLLLWRNVFVHRHRCVCVCVRQSVCQSVRQSVYEQTHACMHVCMYGSARVCLCVGVFCVHVCVCVCVCVWIIVRAYKLHV